MNSGVMVLRENGVNECEINELEEGVEDGEGLKLGASGGGSLGG